METIHNVQWVSPQVQPPETVLLKIMRSRGLVSVNATILVYIMKKPSNNKLLSESNLEEEGQKKNKKHHGIKLLHSMYQWQTEKMADLNKSLQWLEGWTEEHHRSTILWQYGQTVPTIQAVQICT